MVSAAEQLARNISFSTFSKAKELQARIWFTLIALIVYRLGAQIPKGHIFAQRIRSPGAIVMCRPHRGVNHVAPHECHHPRTQRMKRPIARGKRHRAAAINESAKGILRRHERLRLDQPLAGPYSRWPPV